MQRNGHWSRASESFKLGKQELRRAKRTGKRLLLSDACAKGWLAAVEAENALLRAKGTPERALPRNFRGQRYLLQKHAGRETARMLSKLWTGLHVAGYYWGDIEPVVAEDLFGELAQFLQRIESHLK